MGCETTLGRKTDTLFLGILEDFSGFVDATCDLLGILKVCDFGTNQSENNGLVLGQISQRLEIASSRSIIYQSVHRLKEGHTFKIISVTVNLIEEFDSNSIISSFGKVNTPLEISSAQVQSTSHILGMSSKTIIVQFNITVQNLVGVNASFFHSLKHRNCAKVGEKRIINLNVSASCFVQVCNFFTICFCDVGKVSFFVGIGFFGESVVSMTKMEPFGSSLGT